MADQPPSAPLPPSSFKAPVVPPSLPNKDQLANSSKELPSVILDALSGTKSIPITPLVKPKTVEVLPIQTKGDIDLSKEVEKELSLESPPNVPKQNDGIDEVEIRTMQDDLELARSNIATKGVIAGTKKTPIQEVKVKPISDGTIPFMAKSTVDMEAPQSKKNSKATLIKPRSRRVRGAKRVLWAIILLFVIIVGGAAGTWFFYFRNQSVTKQEVRVDASQVIPANAALLWQYRFNSAQDRTDVIGIWGGNLPPTSMTALSTVTGNPKAFVQDEAVPEAFYVLLNDDVRPYLVVPVTNSTQQLFEKATDVQVTKQGGWYIVHTLPLEPYLKALAENSLASAGQADWLKESDQGPIHLLLGSNVLPLLRRELFGDNFIGGQLKSVSLTGQITNGGRNISFVSHPSVKPLSSGALDPKILALVPPNATATYLGTSFIDDLALWRTTSSAPNTSSLDSPVITQRLALLSTPYALFTQNLPSGRSFGLIVTLPDGFAPTSAEQAAAVSVADPFIEQLLPVFIPVLVTQSTVASASFSDANYHNVPLRYSNLVNSAEALDYTIMGNHLLVASSKDTMFALIDAALGSSGSVKDKPEVASILSNKALALTADSGMPGIHDFVLGSSSLPQLTQFLPSDNSTSHTALFGFITQADTNQPKSDEARLILQAVVDLTSQISPTAP